MEPHHWTAFRLIHGPVVIDGLIARVVEAKDSYGGVLTATEVWRGGEWKSEFHESGPIPGRRAVMKAPLAQPEALAQENVPSDPFPPGYRPIPWDVGQADLGD